MDQDNELDMSRWVIVHETPHLAWLGEIDQCWFDVPTGSSIAGALVSGGFVRLANVLVMHTSLVMTGQGPGLFNQVTPPHGMTSPVSITMQCRAVTLVRSLSPDECIELEKKIRVALKMVTQMRAAQAGLVL